MDSGQYVLANSYYEAFAKSHSDTLPKKGVIPSVAYWNQRFVLSKNRMRLKSLGESVGRLTDLTLFQWAQMMSMALEFKPDLILELGRGKGNSTCVFTESAHLLGGSQHCKVVSLCLTDDFTRESLPRLFKSGLVDNNWLEPLECWVTDILFFDFETLLKNHTRILIFWDAHGFEVASCVLGNCR